MRIVLGKQYCYFIGDLIKDFINPIAPIIDPITNIIGGVISEQGQDRRLGRQLDFQKDLAQHQIRYRVADAKAAGLHPLFALGATPQPFSTVIPGGSPLGESIQRMGQSLSQTAVRAGLEATKREDRNLRNKLIESQIGETDARKQYYQSLAATEKAAALQGIAPSNVGVMDEMSGKKPQAGGLSIDRQKSGLVYNDGRVWEEPFGQGLIDVKPSEQKTTKKNQPGILAGQHGAYQEFILPGGQPILLPATEEGSLAEALEAIPFYMWPSIIGLNSRTYGDPWTTDFRDFAVWGKRSKNVYPRAKDIRRKQFFKKSESLGDKAVNRLKHVWDKFMR